MRRSRIPGEGHAVPGRAQPTPGIQPAYSTSFSPSPPAGSGAPTGSYREIAVGRDLKEQLYRDSSPGSTTGRTLTRSSPQLADFGDESSIIMIKPDNFKLINDRCGHEAGDKALRLIAFSIRSQVREKDVAVRYRGDEFAVILRAPVQAGPPGARSRCGCSSAS